MASEPERPIEKVLRATAQQRRDAAGQPAMHPATRRFLQGEVRRHYAPGAPPAGRSLRLGLLGWSFGLLVVLGLAAALWLPSPRPDSSPAPSLARNAQTPPAPTALTGPEAVSPTARSTSNEPQPPALPGASSGGAPSALRQLQEADAPVLLPSARLSQAPKAQTIPSSPTESRSQDFLASAPAPGPAQAPVPAPVPAPAQGTAGELARGASPPPPAAAPATTASARRYGLAATARDAEWKDNAAVPAGAPQVAALDAAADRESNSLAREELAMSQVTRAAGVAAASHQPAVLTSFRVKQSGQDLRIEDSDGSVYLGYVQAAPAARFDADAKSATPPQEAFREHLAVPAATKEAGSRPQKTKTIDLTNSYYGRAPDSAGYTFRVSGTNRTLNQPVVFTGTLLGNANGVAFVRPTNLTVRSRVAAASEAPKTKLKSRNLSAAPAVRLSGTALIGDAPSPIRIEAQPAQP